MYKDTYKIADKIIEINSIYEEVHNLCKEYRYDGTADFIVSIQDKDIEYEREKNRREDIIEKNEIRLLRDSYLETLAVYRKIADKMLESGTLLFHGSAIAVDNEAYIFTAKSGTGKSTHTRLWREMLGSKAVMVNDDKPLINVTDKGCFVCGTPWDGKHRISSNIIVPLKAICIIERDKDNSIEHIEAGEALPMILQQSHRPGTLIKQAEYFKVIDMLLKNIDLYRLRCNISREAAMMSYETMSGRIIKGNE